jgi:hypothetical protein
LASVCEKHIETELWIDEYAKRCDRKKIKVDWRTILREKKNIITLKKTSNICWIKELNLKHKVAIAAE